MSLTFLSVCDGMGCAALAFTPLGWRQVLSSEIEAAPRAVLEQRFGATDVRRIGPHSLPLWGDFTALRIRHLLRLGVELPDVLCGGTPCFPAGTFITTPGGLRSIEQIRVGDLVLTHKLRFQRVLRIGSKWTAETAVVKGQGHPGLITTPEHPFYSRQKQGRSTRVGGKAVRLTWTLPATWTDAKDLAGKHWASAEEFPPLPIPEPEMIGRESASANVDAALMWLAGAYVGDGWPRITERRGYIIYGVNEAKAALILAKAAEAGLHVTISKERTTTRLQIASGALSRWMDAQFGHGADSKRLPGWIFGAPEELRRAFLDGYIAMDGSPAPHVRGMRIVTISRELAIGTRMLANSLGHASSLTFIQPKRETCIIEGRTVNERPYWTVTVSNSDRTSFASDGMRFGLVRSVTAAGPAEVFNLEVEADNSYCADGFIVHNCQDFSIAGLRAGLNGARGNLTLSFIRLANAIDAARRARGLPALIILWENVPGVFSGKSNPFGNVLAAMVGEDAAIDPVRGKWTDAGLAIGPRRTAAWRTLDSQYFGLAQRRERVFIVASARNGFDPAAVLLESEGLRRNSPPSREKGPAVAALTANGVGTCGADDNQGQAGHLIAEIATTLRTGYGAKGVDSAATDTLICQAFGGNNTRGPIDVATTLNSHGGPHGRLDFESETFVVAPDLANALRAEGFDASEDGTGRQPALIAISYRTAGDGAVYEEGDLTAPLTTGTDQSASIIAFALRGREDGAVPEVEGAGDSVGALRAASGGSSRDYIAFDTTQITSATNRSNLQAGDPCHPLSAQAHPPAIAGAAVRRLTPTECARLQGVPDDHCRVTYRGKPLADGPIYKMLGNGWSIPPIRWIGERIQAEAELSEIRRAA